MTALICWSAYHLILYGAWPVVFRGLYGRWPFAYREWGSFYSAVDGFLAILMTGYLGWLAWDVLGGRESQPITVVGGVGLVAGAGGLRVWTLITLGPNFRIGQDDEETGVTYVSGGPYRFLPHPINTGLVLAAMGQALLTGLDLRAGLLVGGTLGYGLIQGVAEKRRWGRGAEPPTAGS